MLISVDPKEVVPVSTRLGQLEGMVKNLTESFKDFKNDSDRRWNMEKQQDGAGGAKGRGGGGAGGVGAGAGGAGAGGNRGGKESYSTSARRSRLSVGLPVGHWDRGQSEYQEQGKEQEQEKQVNVWTIQNNRNRNRNRNQVKYGTGTVVVAGAEAAPICVHIGNVNPKATKDMVRKAIVESANCLQDKPEELKAEQVRVEMVRRKEEDPNPRTRAWKMTVPNLWREMVVERSDFYPRGWSHRQWFNRSSFKKKEEPARLQGAGEQAAGSRRGQSGETPGSGGPARGGEEADVTNDDM